MTATPRAACEASLAEPRLEAVEDLAARIRSFVSRRVPIQDADDVAQDVLLRLHRGVGDLRDAERATAWAYSVARHTIADYYRGRPPAADSLDPEELDRDAHAIAAHEPTWPGFGQYEGDHDLHEEVLLWLRPLADSLDPLDRQALVLADFERRPQREVAEALGLSLSGAKSRVQRARKKLGERLQDCCEIALGEDGRPVDFRRRQGPP